VTATDHRVSPWRLRRPVRRSLARAPLALAVAAMIGAAPAAINPPEPAVDLTISVRSTSDDGGPIRAGQVFTYTLTVRNLGTAEASGVVVRDVLPAIRPGTSIFPPHEQGGFTCRVAEEPGPTAAVTCAGGSVPAGGGAVIRFQAAFGDDPDDAVLRAFGDADPDEPLLIATTATVDPDDAIAESDEGNNIDGEQTTLRLPPAPGAARPTPD
jgi:uncharacterized repeat protein (TIGR01451 family)